MCTKARKSGLSCTWHGSCNTLDMPANTGWRKFETRNPRRYIMANYHSVRSSVTTAFFAFAITATCFLATLVAPAYA